MALAALALSSGPARLCLGADAPAVQPTPASATVEASSVSPSAADSPGTLEFGGDSSESEVAGTASLNFSTPTTELSAVSGSAAPGTTPTARIQESATPESPASNQAWRLSLPDKDPVLLRTLGDAAPVFSIQGAALYAGLTLHWNSSEKLLELSCPKSGIKALLVLGETFFVVQDRRMDLAGPMLLAQGAPALGAQDLQALIKAMGCAQPQWAAASAAQIEAAPPATPVAAPQPTSVPFAGSTSTAHASARPLTGAEIRTIVVDAGHGGKDPGARGPDGLREKDVCLDIALRLRRALNERDPGLRVVLTRDRNVFVSLQERTAIANRAKGDLFVSIHNNASPDEDTHGTQVFFFDSQSSDRAAADISMRENAEANQLDILMTDLAKSIVRDQSIGFASLVQRALGHAINLKHRDISYAPFYVLARTEMPAILVEVAFITNPHEEALLGDSEFRQKVAVSIAKGVENYVSLAQGKR